MIKYTVRYRILNRLNKFKFFQLFNFSLKEKINGHNFKIPITSGIGMGNLVNSEGWMDKILYELKDKIKDKFVLDVGVNLGQTLLKIKSIMPDVHYIGFEPNPFCLSYIFKLTEINNLTNVSILPIAISNQTNVYDLLLDNDNSTDSSASIIKNFRKGIKRRFNILAFNPNELSFLNEKKIGLIKIDVEGAELEVLDGFLEIIKANCPIIIIEILPVYSKDNIERLERQNKIQEIIKSIGYEIFRINELNGELIKLSSFDIHSNLALSNYLLKPLIKN